MLINFALKVSELLRDRLIRNITLTIVTRAVAFACTVVTAILVGRYLGPSEFGKFNFALGFTSLVMSITELMAGTVATREIAKEHHMAEQHLSSLFGARVISVLTATVVVLMCTVLISDKVTQTLLLLAMLQLPSWVFQSSEVWYVAMINLTLPNLFRVISHSLLLLLTISFILAGMGAKWLIMAQVLSFWVYSLLTYFATRRSIRFGMPSLKSALSLLYRSFAFGVAQIVWRIHLQSPLVLAYLVCGSFQAGLLAAALKFVAIADWSISVFMLSFYPAMSEVLRDVSLFKRRFISGMATMCAFGASITVLIASCNETLMRLTFGKGFAMAGNVLLALAPTFVLLFILSHIGHAFIALEGQRQYFISGCVSALCTLLFVSSLGHLGGALGAASGLSIASFIGLCTSVVMLHRINADLLSSQGLVLRVVATCVLIAVALLCGWVAHGVALEFAIGLMLSLFTLLIWVNVGAGSSPHLS
jgi:O-antigen/teichoic acid export membrane protein